MKVFTKKWEEKTPSLSTNLNFLKNSTLTVQFHRNTPLQCILGCWKTLPLSAAHDVGQIIWVPPPRVFHTKNDSMIHFNFERKYWNEFFYFQDVKLLSFRRGYIFAKFRSLNELDDAFLYKNNVYKNIRVRFRSWNNRPIVLNNRKIRIMLILSQKKKSV